MTLRIFLFQLAKTNGLNLKEFEIKSHKGTLIL